MWRKIHVCMCMCSRSLFPFCLMYTPPFTCMSLTNSDGKPCYLKGSG